MDKKIVDLLLSIGFTKKGDAFKYKHYLCYKYLDDYYMDSESDDDLYEYISLDYSDMITYLKTNFLYEARKSKIKKLLNG